MKTRFLGLLTAAALCTAAVPAYTPAEQYVYADEWYFAGETCEPLHDTSRDVQKEGVGNPLNFGERNTPADASTEEIRAINHKMTVQEVKYALYKEIDEHWDLISTRLGQKDREKVYALFLGLGSRESTLGEGKIGSDHETAYEDGWGVNSAHAYGTLQTAVTAFAGCDPSFMPEDNVPEMFQYSFTEPNFYDCIISNHMGIRKILHFVEICINEEHMHDYQVVRNSLKGFNTGWCYMAEDDGAYKTYADEICSMAQFYYYEGHLYDNVFTWTSAGGEMEKYRTDDRWSKWWGDGEPSMAEVKPTESQSETDSNAPGDILCGDANCDDQVNMADAVLIMQSIGNPDKYTLTPKGEKNADTDESGDITNKDALAIQKYKLDIISSLPYRAPIA
ncbi:MAG: dockerin type I repeat-containing protein [Ruminococcus sp.]|nr:dockerin type I repeat-containing protein [Ruminococcus sp.]